MNQSVDLMVVKAEALAQQHMDEELRALANQQSISSVSGRHFSELMALVKQADNDTTLTSRALTQAYKVKRQQLLTEYELAHPEQSHQFESQWQQQQLSNKLRKKALLYFGLALVTTVLVLLFQGLK